MYMTRLSFPSKLCRADLPCTAFTAEVHTDAEVKLTVTSNKINEQREFIALNGQRTQQQRPESPTVPAPGMRVNAVHITSIKGTSS